MKKKERDRLQVEYICPDCGNIWLGRCLPLQYNVRADSGWIITIV